MSELEGQLIEDKAVLPLELFFDLVFVLGITQTVSRSPMATTARLSGEPSWCWRCCGGRGPSSAGRRTPSTCDPTGFGSPFLPRWGAALIMAVSVPTAFEDGGLWLAIGYGAVRGIGVWIHITGTTDQVMQVAIGIIAAERPLDRVLAITMLLAMAAAASLWWSYFDRFAETVESALRESGDKQGVIAHDAYSLGHFPMIAGVVLFTAAAEEIVAHPGDPLESFTRLLLALSSSRRVR